ncbi:MAG: tRNA lysidine(34) synthetase TilS [Actinomycetota bacterium]|nr:tRNA lysidine(34) synthetase TilS [Actinomycetota bacterium]
MSDLADTVRDTSAAYDMLPAGGIVLVLVSGGADSTGLLRLLMSGDIGTGFAIHVLHVNHLLRGADSECDEEFVRRLCETLKVPFHAVRYDVAAFARDNGLNLEDAGRQVRYRLAEETLDSLCAVAGVPPERGRIAVAHTLDDRIETLLMRLAQGTGATGLVSLRPVRDRIVRPLADAARDDVRDYLRALGQEWREDASNLDTTRVRARVRHELLPVLRDINPQVDQAIARTLALLTDEDALLATMGAAFARDFSHVSPGEVAFDRAMMATLSRPMRRRAIRAALASAFPEASRIEFEHVEALVDGLSSASFARDLPDGLRAQSEYGRMIVLRSGEGSPALAPSLLPIPGNLDLAGVGSLIAEEVDPSDTTGTPDSVVVDAGAAEAFVVDRPRDGDRMRPLGLGGTKKLQDLLVDAKVPQRFRQTTPVVRDGESVVWVAGVRMAEEYRITGATIRAVRLTWERGGGDAAEAG